jgi:hypothetical protein
MNMPRLHRSHGVALLVATGATVVAGCGGAGHRVAAHTRQAVTNGAAANGSTTTAALGRT